MQSSLKRKTMAALAALLSMPTMAVPALADVTLHGLFTDHMVLQRDVPVPVHGRAAPGEQVTVTFANQRLMAKAANDGTWSVTLKPMKASTHPAGLTVEGKNKIALQDIVIGDVWVCSGQSNMEFMLDQCNRPEDIQSADLPLLRQFHVARAESAEPRVDVQSSWTVSSPATAGKFTAVGFHFGRNILKETGVPVGLILSAWGGTPIEPWITPEAQKPIPDGLNVPINIPFSPCKWNVLYNAMIHPLIKNPIKGVIWYQGESNAIFDPRPNVENAYLAKMEALVSGWRKAWGTGDFPFYYVQLATNEPPTDDPSGGAPKSVDWGKVCMAQMKALRSIPNTGMAVAIDLADAANTADIHPKNKVDVGDRLARWALTRDYGKKGLTYSGPLYKAMRVEGRKIRIAFDHAGSGLMVGTKQGYAPVTANPQAKLQRFAIAGEDKKWVWADAVIDGKTVVVSSPEVTKPVAVRYAFAANPAGCNLYNKEGLPASPFRTDDW